MKTYLVGGAVRDRLLGRPVLERDWVVVGATPEDLRSRGYRQVGRDFPVFLHPETGEEYALARKERKTGPGYAGFEFDTSPSVTLEEDLSRRDLTINAMAETDEGDIIDPFNGMSDLKAKKLRHVSDAFSEDPVRILRVARFAARFAGSGFQVAPETLVLMRTMVVSGEVDALVAERVWKELERALAESHPEVFFAVLEECHALSRLFPETVLGGVSALKRAVILCEDPVIRLAALLHGFSEHETDSLCQRFRVPGHYYELAVLVSRHLSDYRSIHSLQAAQMVEVFNRLDAFRRGPRFDKWLLASSSACFPEGGDDCLAEWKKVHAAAGSIDMAACVQGAEGAAIKARIQQARCLRVEAILKKTLP